MQLSGQYGPAGGIAVNANAKVKIDKSMDE
jgi:hypothetical protein